MQPGEQTIVDIGELVITVGNMKGSDGTTTDQCCSFTLIELMIVVAVIAILIGLLMPALNAVKTKARATQCSNNIRQLQMGWTMFISDHDDELPHNSDRDEAGRTADHPSWVAGRLRTEHEGGDHSANFNTALLVDNQYAEFESIGLYVKNPDVYRCPGDMSGRVRSVAMNCYLNGTGIWQLSNYVTYKRLSDIHNPSTVWVFIDEREDSINDGYFAVEMAARYALIDYPASYHNGSATLSFADGHIEPHRWVEASTTPPLRRGYHLPGGPKSTSAADRDMRWLIERTTVKRE